MFFFFFFSSRRRHTRSKRDWSSDVCSSDLEGFFETWQAAKLHVKEHGIKYGFAIVEAMGTDKPAGKVILECRSEERREGKSVDLGGRSIIKKKKKIVEEERKIV